jgi:hypothetical protein
MNLETRELMGRARLIDELREDGVNVAFPTCAGEIDLLAYVDSRIAACTVVSVPIKIVSFRSDASSSNLDAARASGLLIALVWDISNPAHVRTFALTRADIIVVKMIEIIERAASARFGELPDRAITPEAVLRRALEPFAMFPGKWREKIAAILEAESISSAYKA